MDLDRITLEVRPRNRWESIDLGFILARSCAKRLWGAWVVCVVPVAIAIFALFHEQPLLGALLIWWLKPMYDRVALHVLSHAVFGATPAIRETVNALPRIMPGLLAALTRRRFDFARSLNLSIWQLEGLRGRTWRNRMALLEHDTGGTAAAFTIACLLFEGALTLALFALVYLMVPPEIEASGADWLLDDIAAGWLGICAYLVAHTIIEPLYVAGGFALYLNRRTQLEGWDIEIGFRRMAGRMLADPVREAS